MAALVLLFNLHDILLGWVCVRAVKREIILSFVYSVSIAQVLLKVWVSIEMSGTGSAKSF